MKSTITAGAAILLALPAFAQDVEITGDAAAGEKVFRQCQTCHVVADADGNTLAGKAAKTGPNLYGIVGEPLGAVEGFAFSDAMVTAGEQGAIWDEASLVSYLQDPTKFLKDTLGDSKARSKMSFRVRKEEDAKNVIAYIYSLGHEGS